MMILQPATKLRLIQPGEPCGKVQRVFARLDHEGQQIPQAHLTKTRGDFDVTEDPVTEAMEAHGTPSGKIRSPPGETKEKRPNTGEKAAEEPHTPVLFFLISSQISTLTTIYNPTTTISRNL